MVSLTSDSAITLTGSAMFTMPSSNLGIRGPLHQHSVRDSALMMSVYIALVVELEGISDTAR